MPHFFCRLNPPRPSFALDMSDDEQRLMGEHGAYWGSLLEQGRVVVFGVVLDPDTPWGVTIVEAADEREAESMTADDPAVLAEAGFGYDIFAMPNAVSRPGR